MLSKLPNELQNRVMKEDWVKKKVIWQEMKKINVPDIPRLTLEELKNITMGIRGLFGKYRAYLYISTP